MVTEASTRPCDLTYGHQPSGCPSRLDDFAGGVSHGYRRSVNGSRHTLTCSSSCCSTHVRTHISARYHRRIPRKRRDDSFTQSVLCSYSPGGGWTACRPLLRGTVMSVGFHDAKPTSTSTSPSHPRPHLRPQPFLPASFLAEALTRGVGSGGGAMEGTRREKSIWHVLDRRINESRERTEKQNEGIHFLNRLMREGSCLAIRTQNTSTCMHACSPIQAKLCLLLFLYRSPPALHTKLLMCCSGAGLI